MPSTSEISMHWVVTDPFPISEVPVVNTMVPSSFILMVMPVISGMKGNMDVPWEPQAMPTPMR